MRTALTTLAAILAATPAFAAVIGPPKKPYADRPTDKPRTHVETVTTNKHAYQIDFHGTVDGVMTRTPIGYAAFKQGWQPNRSVLIENIGQTDLRNPRLIANGKRNWHTLHTIAAEAVGPYTKPRDKARAIYEFKRRTRFHACTWDEECTDAVKVYNIYGYTLCGNEAQILSHLWQAAGLTTRKGYPIGHCVGEVFYDDAYHMMDSDEHVICLLRDNKTIASAADIVRDHDLVKRTHTYSIGKTENRNTDEFSASLYIYEGKRQGPFGSKTRHTMDLTLRPNESLELRWDHVGKQYTNGKPLEKGQKKVDGLGDLLAGWGSTAYDNMRNGKLRYHPNLTRPTAAKAAHARQNAAFDTTSATVKPTDPAKPATVTWRFASPYVFVGGNATATIKLTPNAAARWQYATDAKSWKNLTTIDTPGSHELTACLDAVVSTRGKPTYTFFLQLVLQGPASASKTAFDNDIQTSLLALPELVVGTNRLTYTDATPTDRRVRITHRWLERTGPRPPNPPAAAIHPQNGQTVEGSRFTFQWKPADDPDSDAIVDYHFELAEHPDMRWPLSPNFEKQTSRTPAKTKPQWSIPYVGLLNPDTDYYWRVRALDAAGLWGPWSKTFRFRINAPGVPLDLELLPNGDNSLALTWKPNPAGRPPAAYKIYGSNEKGFSASDTEYPVNRGKGFVQTIEEYKKKPANVPDAGSVKTPPNLITKTTDTTLPVVGPGLTLPNINKAFYRVVAVDAKGNESGPSDYAEVPRPFLTNRPAPNAALNEPYRYQPALIHSIGDFRCQRGGGSSYNAAFWNREQYTFTPVQLPPGLSIDAKTGTITGRPTKTGTHELAFKTTYQTGKPGKSKTFRYKLTVTK